MVIHQVQLTKVVTGQYNMSALLLYVISFLLLRLSIERIIVHGTVELFKNGSQVI